MKLDLTNPDMAIAALPDMTDLPRLGDSYHHLEQIGDGGHMTLYYFIKHTQFMHSEKVMQYLIKHFWLLSRLASSPHKTKITYCPKEVSHYVKVILDGLIGAFYFKSEEDRGKESTFVYVDTGDAYT